MILPERSDIINSHPSAFPQIEIAPFSYSIVDADSVTVATEEGISFWLITGRMESPSWRPYGINENCTLEVGAKNTIKADG